LTTPLDRVTFGTEIIEPPQKAPKVKSATEKPPLRALLALTLLLAPGARAWAGAKIVHGLESSLYSSVGMLVTTDGSLCSGVLIGCQTFLTAAHCICTIPGVAALDGAQCNASPDQLDPARFLVFFQQAGTFRVASVAVHPGYIPETASDLALLRLATPVERIAPTAINTVAKPPFGTVATIAGFGATADNPADGGIKRVGTVTTSSCSGPANAFQICWDFSTTAGPAGTNSSNCRGDSGGPLFLHSVLGSAVPDVVAGIASFVSGCVPPSTAVDSDVFRDRDWITAAAGSDLANPTCGSLPQSEGPETSRYSIDARLDATIRQARFDFPVPGGTAKLRVSLNGAPGNEIFLYAKGGGTAGPASFDCKSEARAAPGGYPLEFCEVESPAPGNWNVLVQAQSGPGGPVQATATLFPGASASSCMADATTLCLDDQPGDGRFKIQVSYQTTQGGGQSGFGTAIPLASLGVRHGGLFWFFSPDNPEMLVKILNGCALTSKFWVFYSAGTNVGLTTTVTDIRSGTVKIYSNPDLTPAAPVEDTGALPCG
jgi:hypothetical protein